MRRVICLVGISGVGKSTLLAKAASRTSFLHLQASDLIKSEQASEKDRLQSSEELRTGAVLDNQELLISGYKRTVADHIGLVVLDGHCVVDAATHLVEVPPSVFRRLECSHVAVLRAPPEIIYRRRAGDLTRTRPALEIDKLRKYQDLSTNLAKQIARQLAVSFTQHESEEPESFFAVLEEEARERWSR